MGQLGEKPGVLLGEIDMNYLSQVRRQLPSLANIRDDVYDLRSSSMQFFDEGGE